MARAALMYILVMLAILTIIGAINPVIFPWVYLILVVIVAIVAIAKSV